MASNVPARGAMAVAMATVLAAPAAVRAHPNRLVVASETAEALDPGEILRSAGPGSMAVHVESQATLDAEGAGFFNDGGGTRVERAFGAFVSDGGGLTLAGGHVRVSGPWGIGVQAQGKARVDLSGSLVEVPGDVGIGIVARRESEFAFDGLTLRADGRQGVALSVWGDSRVVATGSQVFANGSRGIALSIESGEAILRGSLLEGATGHAVRTPERGEGVAVVRMEHSRVRGRIESGAPGLAVHAVGGRIDGDIVRGGTGRLDVNLMEGAWHGRGSRLTTLSLARATWTLTDNSEVDSVRLERGGRIDIGGGHPAFRTLRVGAWHAEAGATGVVLGTRLDAGGTLRRQATGRLLVGGDAVGRTALHVAHVGGHGADTAGRDGANGPGDGISVVQVAGAASAESFRLAGDYVAVGPWQYRLRAFGPEASDPAQRLVAGKGGYWDYRLQSVRTGKNARASLVPQVPAYLVLGHALFGYGRTAIDALRPSDVSPSDAPALRVHTFGGNAMYRGAPHTADGIAYRRTDRGLQVTGDLLVHRIGDTMLRTGASLSAGTARATPRVLDSRSDLRVTARGIAWHAVLSGEGGWEIASYYAHTRYRIDVHTPSRGQVLPRMRATTDEAMVSSAFRWRPTERLLVEPGVSLLWQRLGAGRVDDRDGIDVSIGAPRRVTLRGGARASMSFRPEGRMLRTWSPYVDLRYSAARDAGAHVRAAGVPLPAARAGRRVDLAAGVSFELGERWIAYANATASVGHGRHAEAGRGVRLGAAWTF
ncbi:autotransporter outer membrane beta-barrel domain-containing protein [Luteibacter jiangsuensis]|uniref:Autotransporter outer membrane beta-barrel domain-containing protein n=1 Tax=Luteibacter jiangsuensis TaxID=637577 RepID=A0ABX0Q375_9GAMM|nr:autotransporter outer membrane beta-barrel domain-containing protein [Luteibacter jiangsuensis]NID04984.1 autotransporter outer membrane beta-barrel domain-containing protein [Luteibacter jiangsuensis]